MYPLHVNGLPRHITDQELREVFERVGPVASVKVIRHPDGRCVGIGTVEMRFVQDVDEILASKDRIGIGGIRPHIWKPLSIGELIRTGHDGIHMKFCSPSWYAFQIQGHLRWCFRFPAKKGR